MSTCPMCSHDPPTTRPGTKDLFVDGGDGDLALRVAAVLSVDHYHSEPLASPQERLDAAGHDMVVEDHGWHWYVRPRTAFERVVRQTAGMFKAGQVIIASTPKRNPGLIASLYSRPSMAAQIANAEHERQRADLMALGIDPEPVFERARSASLGFGSFGEHVRREIDAALAGPQEPVTKAQIDGLHIGIDPGVEGSGVTTVCTACRGVDGCRPGCSRSVIGKGRGWGRTAELDTGMTIGEIHSRVKTALAYREGTTDIIEDGPTETELARIDELLERRATRCVSGSAARSCGVP